MTIELKNVREVLKKLNQVIQTHLNHQSDNAIIRGHAANIANLTLQPTADRLKMAIRFDEAEQGDPCPGCDGTGDDKVPSSNGTCPDCMGVGMVYWKPEPQEGLSWSDIITDEDSIYKDICDREHHNHPIYKDEHGTLRWKADPVIEMLWEAQADDGTHCGPIALDLNALAAYGPGKNDPRVRELYRRMGYSLHGYWELFHWEVNNPDADQYKE